MEMTKKIYKKEQIASTASSDLYKINLEENPGEDSLYFVLKENKLSADPEMSRREMEITHFIENQSPFSVLIPVLTIIPDHGVLLQFKKNGLFLNQIIEKLEETYRQIPVEIAVKITELILKSLKYVHYPCSGCGYVHLDLQPCNIFIENADLTEGKEEFGTVKFIDFQCAGKIDETGALAEERGYRWNTPGFSAPEVTGESEQSITYASDLYSAGAIFYRLITGRLYDIYDEISLEETDIHPIIRYQAENFLRCCLDWNSSYRYKNVYAAMEEIQSVRQGIDALASGQYYELLQLSYRNRIPSMEFSIADIDKVQYEKAASRLRESLLARGIDYREKKYIFDGLWNMPAHDSFPDNRTVMSLISSGIAIATHLGNDCLAFELAEKIPSYTKGIEAGEILNLRTRLAEVYSDHFSYEKAEQLVKENVCMLQEIKQTQIRIVDMMKLNPCSTFNIDLARAYSSLGCRMAYRKTGDSLAYFQKAIEEFRLCEDAKKREENIWITISHILHYAIDTGDQDLFEQYAKDYFDLSEETEANLDIWEVRYDSLFKEGINPFALWILLKALICFRKNALTDSLYRKILGHLTDGTYDSIRLEHLHRLVLKNAVILIYSKNPDSEDARKALENSVSLYGTGKIYKNEPLNIIMLINYRTQWIFNRLFGDPNENEKLHEQLCQHASRSGWSELVEWLTEQKDLSEMLNFEYC